MRARRELRDEEARAGLTHADRSGDLRRLCFLIRHAARPGSFAATVRAAALRAWAGAVGVLSGRDQTARVCHHPGAPLPRACIRACAARAWAGWRARC